MKSSFLLSLILGALLTTQVFGQTKKQTTVSSTATPTVEKTASEKFYERLSISYFGAYTSPTLKDWDTTHAAISPELELSDDCNNCDTYSQNLFNQVSFGYNFGGPLKFVVAPRWTMFFSNPKDQDPGDRAMFTIEDMVTGFSGVIYSSSDKKFSWFTYPRLRLPTSHFSRNYNHPQFGRLTYNIEWNNTFTYNFNPTWEVGYTLANRFWIYDNRYNWSRHRIISNPYISYAVSDTTKIQAYFEHWMENNKNWKSINGKDPIYYNNWQNFMVGVSYDITPKLNVLPFVSTFINDVPYSTESYWLGAWVSYSIK